MRANHTPEEKHRSKSQIKAQICRVLGTHSIVRDECVEMEVQRQQSDQSQRVHVALPVEIKRF